MHRPINFDVQSYPTNTSICLMKCDIILNLLWWIYDMSHDIILQVSKSRACGGAVKKLVYPNRYNVHNNIVCIHEHVLIKIVVSLSVIWLLASNLVHPTVHAYTLFPLFSKPFCCEHQLVQIMTCAIVGTPDSWLRITCRVWFIHVGHTCRA